MAYRSCHNVRLSRWLNADHEYDMYVTVAHSVMERGKGLVALKPT